MPVSFEPLKGFTVIDATHLMREVDVQMIARAAALATRAHEGQKRKCTGEPYIEHCQAVAAIVATVPHTPEMIAAAYLHDVIEDTEVTIEEVERECGMIVASYVTSLTDCPSNVSNRATRKSIDRGRLAAAPPEVQTIKYADLIDNLTSIVEHDPNFAKLYRYEKQQLLKVMTKGDPTLYQRAMERAG